MAHFQLDDCMKRSEKLLWETRKIFKDYEDFNLDENTLPETMEPSNGKIKIVFVGQYSAGKSSIIKMLSGNDIAIGAGIETQEAHIYQWDNLEIVDTPGIRTEIYPDHDEKTYYQIDHAALLVFVVTSAGFDNRIGNHFRKLAIEQKRAKNMVLVVNKMNQTCMGNTPEQQEILTNDIRKVIEPFTPEELYLSFLSAEKYFDAQNAEDEEEREINLEDSGYAAFIDNLNAFVKSRGLLSRIQAPLETLKKAITNIIGESDNLMNDKDIDAQEEVFRRKQRTLLSSKERIHARIKELADNCADHIREEGSKAARVIAPGVTEEELKKAVEAAQSQAEIYIDTCDQAMQNSLADICDEMDKNLLAVERSGFAYEVKAKLDAKEFANITMETCTKTHIPNEVIRKTMKSGKDLLGMTKKDARLYTVGGEKLSNVIKNVGHFFGKKFKPWEAVDYVQKTSKVIGGIIIVVSLFQMVDDLSGNKEKEMQDNLYRAQDKLCQLFNEDAEEIRKKMIQTTTDQMDALFRPKLQTAEAQLSIFQEQKERLKALNRELTGVLVKVDTLMDEVQATAKA